MVSLAAVFITAGCSGGEHASKPPAHAVLASGRPLPARCAPGEVRRAAEVTFVANGRAWALEPRSGRVTCLFAAGHPGPFLWGPRGDRALLARLEVKSLGSAPHRPASPVAPPAASWGRPIGKSIVFVGHSGHALLKTHPAGGPFHDVTPVKGAEYKLVEYHPSGLAFAFVLRRSGHESVWVSSNTGAKPHKLVHGRLHTGFQALAFGDAGNTLYFAALHPDNHVDVHKLPLVGADSAPVAWHGKPGETVSQILPGWPGLALTVGHSCESTRAVLVTKHPAGVDAIPGDRPSRAVGWLDDRHLLVAVGGCGSPLDLYTVEHASLRARLLVRNVDAASVRRPEPLPPPPLPNIGAKSSFA